MKKQDIQTLDIKKFWDEISRNPKLFHGYEHEIDYALAEAIIIGDVKHSDPEQPVSEGRTRETRLILRYLLVWTKSLAMIHGLEEDFDEGLEELGINSEFIEDEFNQVKRERQYVTNQDCQNISTLEDTYNDKASAEIFVARPDGMIGRCYAANTYEGLVKKIKSDGCDLTNYFIFIAHHYDV